MRQQEVSCFLFLFLSQKESFLWLSLEVILFQPTDKTKETCFQSLQFAKATLNFHKIRLETAAHTGAKYQEQRGFYVEFDASH